MADPDLNNLTEFATGLADVARGMMADALNGGDVVATLKPDRTFVTAMDASIERRLRQAISDSFPSHGILGEEEPPLNPDAEHVWVLDPIDGTAAFLAGVPVYSTLIALLHKGRPVIGVMDFSGIDARWVGVAGQATRLNGKPVETRACTELTDAFLSTSNPDFYGPDELPVLHALRDRTAWRIYGTAALAYGRLTQGRIDIAVDTGLKLWDFAAFAPIIEGAGGRITDWAGQPISIDTGPRILAAGTPELHERGLDIVGQASDAIKKNRKALRS